ncbi:MAG: L-serine ammonia-lyase, iron-sulfur-dependent, subunit alpha [Firmicutes bacterium HGW-Firmicutes-2]|jgi:L-serine dehydratase|nr:MAG: L-serine ammonia-lyase, iron-sulfur-dependent, subunit alpha [Firmicutes bacterium HGW-Firmicutes-2]
MKITTAKDILQLKQTHNLNLFEIALKYEVSNSDLDQDVILDSMARQWQIMEQAISQGLDPDNQHLHGKILGREAIKLKTSFESGKSICGITTSKAMMYALSTMEVNMAMGQIVAAPTAGASGVLPGTLKALQEAHHLEEKKIIEALFVAGLVGMIIAKQASISGAKGGCQAEIGSAAAMAAAATVYVLDGTMEQSFDAAAIAINNMMGLICDPVAGLVEVPCHKRNALGAANALLCAEMVLAGLPSVIPFDEVVQAMKQVGDLLPACHRETATGGIAISKTAKSIEASIMNDE